MTCGGSVRSTLIASFSGISDSHSCTYKTGNTATWTDFGALDGAYVFSRPTTPAPGGESYPCGYFPVTWDHSIPPGYSPTVTLSNGATFTATGIQAFIFGDNTDLSAGRGWTRVYNTSTGAFLSSLAVGCRVVGTTSGTFDLDGVWDSVNTAFDLQIDCTWDEYTPSDPDFQYYCGNSTIANSLCEGPQWLASCALDFG